MLNKEKLLKIGTNLFIQFALFLVPLFYKEKVREKRVGEIAYSIHVALLLLYYCEHYVNFILIFKFHITS